MPTTTWNLPGGHRITGVPTPGDDFTPTFGEWVLSMANPNMFTTFTDQSGESLFYHTINYSMMSVSVFRGGEFAGFRALTILRHTPALFAASILRQEFERQGALGPGSPAARHNQDAVRSASLGVNDIAYFLRNIDLV